MYEKQHVIQDMLVPMKKIERFADVQFVPIYPLWICPYRAYDNGSKGVLMKFLENTKDLAQTEMKTMAQV